MNNNALLVSTPRQSQRLPLSQDECENCRQRSIFFSRITQMFRSECNIHVAKPNWYISRNKFRYIPLINHRRRSRQRVKSLSPLARYPTCVLQSERYVKDIFFYSRIEILNVWSSLITRSCTLVAWNRGTSSGRHLAALLPICENELSHVQLQKQIRCPTSYRKISDRINDTRYCQLCVKGWHLAMHGCFKVSFCAFWINLSFETQKSEKGDMQHRCLLQSHSCLDWTTESVMLGCIMRYSYDTTYLEKRRKGLYDSVVAAGTISWAHGHKCVTVY